MKPRFPLVTALLAIGASLAAGSIHGQTAKVPPDTPLIVDGPVRVEAADFEGNILRVPEDRRNGFRMSYDRVSGVVDSIFVARSLAQKARDAGMDKDPAVQARLRQVQDSLLADLYTQKLEKDSPTNDLTARVRELYVVDKDKYMTDEEVHIQQVLINTTCHSSIEARELARRAYDEVKDGKADFLDVARKYNDSGEKSNKGGDVGTGPVKRLAAPVREAIANMKPGDISEPVESQFGYHVLKLVARKAPAQKPLEAVSAEIAAAERARLQRKRVEDAVNEVRNSKTVITYRQNVDKLVVPGASSDELSQKARDAHRDQPRKK